MIRYFSLAVLVLIIAGCGITSKLEVPVNPDKYHIGQHEWIGDSIQFELYRTGAPSDHNGLPSVSVECKSCNLVVASVTASQKNDGNRTVYFPEAHNLISVRLHVKGSGIDTTFIQKQRLPQEATAFYHLDSPLTGRVLTSQFAVLYTDTTLDSAVTTSLIGDELNMYNDRGAFYCVHHPSFPQPLYLLKSNAIRLY